MVFIPEYNPVWGEGNIFNRHIKGCLKLKQTSNFKRGQRAYESGVHLSSGLITKISSLWKIYKLMDPHYLMMFLLREFNFAVFGFIQEEILSSQLGALMTSTWIYATVEKYCATFSVKTWNN